MGWRKKLRIANRLQKQVDDEIDRRLAGQKEKIRENLMKEWQEKKKKESEVKNGEKGILPEN